MRFVNWFNCIVRNKHEWEAYTHILLFASSARTKHYCIHCNVIKEGF